MGKGFHRFSKWFVPHKKRVHIAVFILSLFMIPGALTALQPIDMESYEMESPELTAQTIINDEFSNSEIILGFVISARDPEFVPSMEDWSPVPSMSDGAPDYSSLPDIGEMVEAGEPWQGISAPKGVAEAAKVASEAPKRSQGDCQGDLDLRRHAAAVPKMRRKSPERV